MGGFMVGGVLGSISICPYIFTHKEYMYMKSPINAAPKNTCSWRRPSGDGPPPAIFERGPRTQRPPK